MTVVNSLCKNNSIRVKFLDDLVFADIIDTKDNIVFPTQNHLNTQENECIEVNVTPNPIKCENMYSMPPKRPIVLPDLTLNGTPLPVVSNI